MPLRLKQLRVVWRWGARGRLGQRVAVRFHARGNTGWNQTVAILAQDEVPVGKTGLVSWVVVRVTGPRRDQGSLLGAGTNFGGLSLPEFSPVTSCGSRPRRALG